jgi:pimeloyl-ACP methyl ester carboxylesterase
MSLVIKEIQKIKYIEEGDGPALLLLHGLFGALSNFKEVIEEFKCNYRVIVPMLPIYNLPLTSTGIGGLVKFMHKFISQMELKEIILLGNSLGGHVALAYTLKYSENIKALILTGSSGLYENTLGGTYPKRGDYDFVKEKTEYTFYNPKTATKELVDEVYDIVNTRDKAIRVIALSRSAMRNNLSKELHKVKVPVALIWGKDDNITPAFVAKDFHELLPNSELNYISECGHAAMMEKPHEFNLILKKFLNKVHNAS